MRDVLRSTGRPLDGATRELMESRFAHDFSRVRVHTDERAAQSARAVDALAYTVGQHVVFGSSQYEPHTQSGRMLLAHELTHTIQQPAFSPNDLASLRVSQPDETSEREAEATGEAVARSSAPAAPERSAVQLARAPCWSGDRCKTPHQSAAAASTKAFGTPTQTNLRARRRALCQAQDPACASDGHGARAVELEKILNDLSPLRSSDVQGVFVDVDFPSDAAAYNAPCAEFETTLGGLLHPFTGNKNGTCAFFPKAWEEQALEFRTTQNPMIGGKTREMWLLNTRRELTHETEHGRFAGVTLGGPTKGACSFDKLNTELSEIAARMAEFPVVFRDIRRMVSQQRPVTQPLSPSALADATWADPRFQKWLDNRINSPGESIKGSVKSVRCTCPCDQANRFISDTADSVMDSASMPWTEDEKKRFNDELQEPKWGLDWPVTYSNLNLEPVPDLPGRQRDSRAV